MKNATIWGILLIVLAPMAIGVELTSMSLHAPSIQQGQPVTLTYTIVGDNALGSVTTDVFLSGSINHKDMTRVSAKRYQHTQTFVLPQTHQENDEVRVRISVPGETPIIATIPLTRSSSQQQGQVNADIRDPQTFSDQEVVVIVDPVRDIMRGESVYYRTQIYNTADEAKTVTIGLSDVGSWATYRVDPYPTVRIPANSMHEAYIYLKVDADARPGITYFDVTAHYDQTSEREGVRIAVLQPLQKSTLEHLRPWIISAALILLLVALLAVVLTRNKKKQQKGGDDDDFITYY